MSKTLDGVVVSTKMNNAVVVEITRRVPHPKYKKLLKRSKKFTAALNGQKASVGEAVSITETRPISKTIHFVVSKVQKKEEKKL
jgi:small subunit ribosomal protein S17